MPQEIYNLTEQKMQKALEFLRKDFIGIRTGKANPSVLNGLTVEYYGVATPINQIASVSAPEPQAIVVKPYDKSILKGIEKAIQTANLGFNPLNNGEVIRIPIPALTEQTRKELVKEAKKVSENHKVVIRNIRREAIEKLRKLEKDSLISEDELKRNSDKIQKLTDDYIAKVDQETKVKEQDIMSI